MAEAASNARELVEALSLEEPNDKFFPLNELPNDVLVSVFAAAEDPTWVRHTFPCVCKAWAALYRTKDASPLHETLEVDFGRAMKSAVAAARAREVAGRRVPAPGFFPLVHGSSVISWAERRAGSVHKLRLKNRAFGGALKYFTARDFAALVAVVAPSLNDISIGPSLGDLCERPFWEVLRTSVVPAGRLRSFFDEDMDAYTFKSVLAPLLGQLAGSLEELVVEEVLCSDDAGLTRFPESLFSLEKLRRLDLSMHGEIKAVPAGISSLKKLEDLRLCSQVSSLPKELGELSGLTRLGLECNDELANTPQHRAFPAELGRMKSLRVLDLNGCKLRTVPAFVGELKSLESLDLSGCRVTSLPKELGEFSGLTRLMLGSNEQLGTAPRQAFPAELGKMESLRDLDLRRCGLRTVPAFVVELKSLESLDLSGNDLSSLPKELVKLSGLTKLDLSANKKLAFPEVLKKMKSLRELELTSGGLRSVPAFLGGLESLESLGLESNDVLQIGAPLDFLIEGCPRLREVRLAKEFRYRWVGGTVVPRVMAPWTPESLAHLKAFQAKLRAKNPDAKVSF